MTHQLTGQTSQLPARVHPDDRGRIEGLNALATLIQGAPQPKRPSAVSGDLKLYQYRRFENGRFSSWHP